MADVAPGVIGDVQVLVISVDLPTAIATVRVIDNNGAFLSPAAPIPMSVVRPTHFPVAVGDVLEQTSPEKRTAVVRWVSGSGGWSESPTGTPVRDTVGWKRIGTFPLP